MHLSKTESYHGIKVRDGIFPGHDSEIEAGIPKQQNNKNKKQQQQQQQKKMKTNQLQERDSDLHTRTIRFENKHFELAKTFSSNGIRILGIAYHNNVYNEDEIRLEILDRMLIPSSAWRNNNQAACRGNTI